MRYALTLLLALIISSCVGIGSDITFDAVNYTFSDQSKVTIDNTEYPLTPTGLATTYESPELNIIITTTPLEYYSGYDLVMTVLNTSAGTAIIHWKEATIIDSDFIAHPVGISGMKYADMSKGIQTDTIIPKGTKGVYTVLMADTVQFVSTGSISTWAHTGLYPGGSSFKNEEEIVKYCKNIFIRNKSECVSNSKKASANAIKQVTEGTTRLVIPITVNGTKKEYDFTLKLGTYTPYKIKRMY